VLRYSDWKRPTDEAYAFKLRPSSTPLRPALGTRSDIRDVVRAVLESTDAQKFETKVTRWGGPEDEDASGARPYEGPQQWFTEAPWVTRLSRADLEPVLRGEVRVMRGEGVTDYVLRDHHTLDVVLYHRLTTGELPRALFHADRHSDWCKDSYLEARVPDQAATWWSLLEGLKTPEGPPVLTEKDVRFVTALAPRDERTAGRDVGASGRIPGWLDPDTVQVREALLGSGTFDADWASLDLDCFLPRSQLRAARPLLEDARLGALLRSARVRLFVLSPQFAHGGDRHERWVIQGSVHSTLRLLNWLRTN
jgi:hypothetical protein